MTQAVLAQAYALAKCESRQRDQGTTFGFAWTLLNPFLNWLILFLLFADWARGTQQHYSLYLLIGLVYWGAFGRMTQTLLSVYSRRRFLASNVPLEPSVLYIASFCSILLPFLVENVIILFICALLGTFSLQSLWALTAASGLLCMLAFPVGILLSTINVFFRDTAHLWSMTLRLGFFLTPIFLPKSFIAERTGEALVTSNPMAGILDVARIAIAPAANIDLSALAVVGVGIVLASATAALLLRKVRHRLVESI